jgi:Cupredoxin-like domain
MVRKAAVLGVVCVLGLVLFVWWSGGERKKSSSPAAGKQEPMTSRTESRSRFGDWVRSWILPDQGSQSAGWDPKDVEEAIRKTFLAYNRQDLRAFKAGWTAKGFQQVYESPKEKVIDFIPLSLLSFRPYKIEQFSNTTVNEQSATTEVALTHGDVQETHRFSLVREEDAWRIDQDEKVPNIPNNPAVDSTVVGVKLQYHNMQLERTRLTPGTVTFKITNTDTQRHEFIVKKIMESDNEETIGMIKPLEPGQSETLILANLARGRYVAMCNMLSRDGVPFANGMRNEFTVE